MSVRRPVYSLACTCGLLFSLISLSLFAAEPISYEAIREKAISPQQEPIKLFNGENLDGLYTWLKETGHEDPEKVFRVTDGMLHVTGNGLGAVLTEGDYKDYHAVVEFKWGPRTWAHRTDRTRDSGLLFHCVGPDNSYGNTWPNSIEAQIIEGGVGDVIVVRGTTPEGEPMPISVTAEVTQDRDGENVWHKGGERKVFQGGRINWYGRDPDWEDVLGFRGKEDVDSPVGKWTRMDVICEKDHVLIKVNGVTVNELFEVSPTAGRLLIQTEMAELFVRRWELWPLGKAPEFNADELNNEP
ncbi:MAG: DUF1080 domain-containing protein [Planctomycetaceae bacterium]|nr:DUF1080 domain-containing protein [Planctomycetaceae bacterium]